jgi:hypothetical protein
VFKLIEAAATAVTIPLRTFGVAVTTSAGLTLDAFSAIANALPGVPASIRDGLESAKATVESFRRTAVDGLKNAAASVVNVGDEIADLQFKQDAWNTVLGDTRFKLEQAGLAAVDIDDILKNLTPTTDEAAKAFRKLAEEKAFAKLAQDALTAAEDVEEFLRPMQLVGIETGPQAEAALEAIKLEMLGIAAAAKVASAEDLPALIEQLKELIKTQQLLQGVVDEQKASQERLQDQAAQTGMVIGDSFGSAFGSILNGASNAEDAFTQFAKTAKAAALDAAEKIATAAAVKWAVEAGSSQAGVPIVGPALAAAAASAAFALAKSFILKLGEGGIVPGTGNRDSVPALLTPGELVVPAPVVKDFMGLVRSPSPGPAFQQGGMVSEGGGPTVMQPIFQSLGFPDRAQTQRWFRDVFSPEAEEFESRRI